MKKNTRSRTGAMTGSSDGEQGFWPSYADMMSAVALILFFLMLLSYIQNLITGNDLQSTQEVLASTRVQLTESEANLLALQAQIQDVQTKLTDAEADLAAVSVDLENANSLLTEKQQEIDKQTLMLNSQEQEIQGQSATITSQQALIDSQKDYLAATTEELVKMRNQMQTIAVLRLSILEQIRDNIVQVMGDSSKVSIGENGNIILSEGILFDVGSADIKDDSKEVLDQMIKVFTSFLGNAENAKYVDSIVISGHTDSTGTDSANRVLSTERANGVMDYLMSGNGGSLKKYSAYFCSAGYGESRPVASNNTDAGRAANRRIEISIILKDESVLEIVDQYLAVELPGTDNP